jgi:hypothetical protein
VNTKNLLLGIFVLLVVVLASLTLSEYYKLSSQPPSQSVSTSSTQTLTSTTTITSTPVIYNHTTSTSATTTVSSPFYTTGSFTYKPTGQVQVDSVQATGSRARDGRLNVTFVVIFENIGSAPINTIGGSDGELSSLVATNSSSVLQKVASQSCSGMYFIVTLNPGQSYTLYTPDCYTGFNYQLIHPGSVDVRLGFNWTTNLRENPPFSNSTTISARFTLA